MASVGLSTVYKYGTRFLAQLLVVVLIGVVLVLVGDLIGRFTVGTVTNPGLRTPPSQVGWVGVAIAGVGVFGMIAGFVGLVFKLVADATMTGARQAALSEGIALAGAEPRLDDAESVDEDGPVSDQGRPDPPQQPVSAAGQADTGLQGGTPQQTGHQHGGGQPQRGEAAHPDVGSPSAAPTTQPGQSRPSNDQPPAPGNTAGAHESQAPGERSSTPGADPSTAETATGPDSRDAQRRDTGESETRRADRSSSQREEPQEWTPPDPEEFEQHQSTKTSREDSADVRDGTEVQDGADEQEWRQPAASERDPGADEVAGRETTIVDESETEPDPAAATSWEDLRKSNVGDTESSDQRESRTGGERQSQPPDERRRAPSETDWRTPSAEDAPADSGQSRDEWTVENAERDGAADPSFEDDRTEPTADQNPQDRSVDQSQDAPVDSRSQRETDEEFHDDADLARGGNSDDRETRPHDGTSDDQTEDVSGDLSDDVDDENAADSYEAFEVSGDDDPLSDALDDS